MSHRPLQFGIGGPDLLFVRAVVTEKAVRRRRSENRLRNPQPAPQFVHLGLGEVGNRTDVHPSVAVLGEEPHSEILYLVPRTDHEQIIESGEVVECGHAKPRPGIGSGQVGHPFARPLHQRGSERAGERIVRRRQVGMCRLCIGITFRQPADVLPGPVHLCLYLMDRQCHAERSAPGHSRQCRNYRRIDTPRNAHDESRRTRSVEITRHPLRNIMCNCFRIHISSSVILLPFLRTPMDTLPKSVSVPRRPYAPVRTTSVFPPLHWLREPDSRGSGKYADSAGCRQPRRC